MPIIPIPNGTHYIKVECATLTFLSYIQDEQEWQCNYTDEAFGLFAIGGVVLIFLPILFIIYCCIKVHHINKDNYHRIPNFHESSYSSMYPDSSSRDLPTLPGDTDGYSYKPRWGRGQQYYPYPAYGTQDEPSRKDVCQPYPVLTVINKPAVSAQNSSQSVSINNPVIPTERPYISSSDPVVTTVLRDNQKRLQEQQHIEDKVSFSSLPDMRDIDQLERNGDVFTKNAHNDNFGDELDWNLLIGSTKKKKSECNRTSCDDDESKNMLHDTVTENHIPREQREDSSKTLPNQNAINNDLMEKDERDGNNGDDTTHSENNPSANDIVNNNKFSNEDTDRDRLQQNRNIISATPPCNMINRQDFDDYLSNCVLKLPDDKRNGTFLIRHSTSKDDSKVMTMYCKSEENIATLYYFKICYSEKGEVYLAESDRYFKTIDELIQRYRVDRSTLPCLLGECLGKNF